MHNRVDREKDISILHPAYGKKIKTHLFYDMVHKTKNIRNNLLGKKKFVFAESNFETRFMSLAGYEVFFKNCTKKLGNELKKAHKTNHSVLHPGNNKQNVGRI